VSPSTTFTEGGQGATLADVTVGAPIFATGTIDANLTTLDALTVRIDSSTHALVYHGVVTAASSSSVTITRLNGVVAHFAIMPTTVFTQGKNVLTDASLAVGDHVDVQVNSGPRTPP